MKTFKFSNGMAVTVPDDVTLLTGNEAPPPPPPLVTTPAPKESEIAEMARRKPIALAWRYANRAELAGAALDKKFGQRLELVKATGVVEVIVPANGPTVNPVSFVEQADGSVVYSTYLDRINQQATGRDEPLPAYAFRAEALNDWAAIKLDQIVRIGGLQVWPTDGPGFGPGFDYMEMGDGTLVMVGSGAGGDITIEDF